MPAEERQKSLAEQLKQEWETYALLSLARTEDIEIEGQAPTEPPPPRFTKPVGYVRSMTGMLRDFGVLARPGGVDAQSANLIRDMITWMNGQNYQLYQMRKKLDERAREHGSDV